MPSVEEVEQELSSRDPEGLYNHIVFADGAERTIISGSSGHDWIVPIDESFSGDTFYNVAAGSGNDIIDATYSEGGAFYGEGGADRFVAIGKVGALNFYGGAGDDGFDVWGTSDPDSYILMEGGGGRDYFTVYRAGNLEISGGSGLDHFNITGSYEGDVEISDFEEGEVIEIDYAYNDEGILAVNAEIGDTIHGEHSEVSINVETIEASKEIKVSSDVEDAEFVLDRYLDPHRIDEDIGSYEFRVFDKNDLDDIEANSTYRASMQGVVPGEWFEVDVLAARNGYEFMNTHATGGEVAIVPRSFGKTAIYFKADEEAGEGSFEYMAYNAETGDGARIAWTAGYTPEAEEDLIIERDIPSGLFSSALGFDPDEGGEGEHYYGGNCEGDDCYGPEEPDEEPEEEEGEEDAFTGLEYALAGALLMAIIVMI